MRNFGWEFAVIALMPLCGLGAAWGCLSFLMWLGTRIQPAATLIYVAFALGFVAPAVVACQFHNKPWHFSLRTLLIVTTLIAVVLGLVVWASN